MSNRKPLALNSFLVIYNLGLMLLSVYMFVEVSVVSVAIHRPSIRPKNDD